MSVAPGDFAPSDKSAPAAAEEDKTDKSAAPPAAMMADDEFVKGEGGFAKFILHPVRSKFRRNWDFILTIFIIYNSIMVPFRVSFGADATGAVAVLDDLIDYFFLADVVLNFFTGYVTAEGAVVADPKLIARKYLKLWFWIDVVSAFPVNAVINSVDDGGASGSGLGAVTRLNTLLRLLKLIRLIRILRILRLNRIFMRFQFSMQIKYSTITILKFVCFVLLFAHFNTCMWFLTARLEDINADYEGVVDHFTWVDTYDCPNSQDPNDGFCEGIREASYDTQYFVAFVHTIMTMSTIGATIIPTSVAEKLYAVCSMLIGVSVFAYFISNVCSLVFNRDEANMLYRQKIDEVTEYCKVRKLPHDLRFRIRDFFNYIHSRNMFMNEKDILSELSASLRAEVLLKVNEHLLKGNEFFRGLDINLVSSALVNSQVRTFMPNEWLLRDGERGWEMYLVNSGFVDVLKRDIVVTTLGRGSFLGEMSFLKPGALRTADARALTFVDAFALRKEHLMSVLERHPDAKRRWAKRARDRVRLLQRMEAQKEKREKGDGLGGAAARLGRRFSMRRASLSSAESLEEQKISQRVPTVAETPEAGKGPGGFLRRMSLAAADAVRTQNKVIPHDVVDGMTNDELQTLRRQLSAESSASGTPQASGTPRGTFSEGSGAVGGVGESVSNADAAAAATAAAAAEGEEAGKLSTILGPDAQWRSRLGSLFKRRNSVAGAGMSVKEAISRNVIETDGATGLSGPGAEELQSYVPDFGNMEDVRIGGRMEDRRGSIESVGSLGSYGNPAEGGRSSQASMGSLGSLSSNNNPVILRHVQVIQNRMSALHLEKERAESESRTQVETMEQTLAEAERELEKRRKDNARRALKLGVKLPGGGTEK